MLNTMRANSAITKILGDMVYDFRLTKGTATEICHKVTKSFAVLLGLRRREFNDWDQAIYAICIEQLHLPVSTRDSAIRLVLRK